MMPKLPSRAALLVPLLALGLLVPSLGVGLTQADTMPAPCGLADVADAATGAEDTLLMLSAILPPGVEQAQANQPPRPNRNAPAPPSPVGAPKAPGTDLRPPDQALLNSEPMMAAREFRESLTDKQKADVQAVITRHRDKLQQARARFPELSAERQGNRRLQPDREGKLHQVSTELTRVGDQIDQELDTIITPRQRALLHKANPKRLRTDMPETPDAVAAEANPGC